MPITVPDEFGQQINNLQNQINDLTSFVYKDNFSNTIVNTKEIQQLTGGSQSSNFVADSIGWRFDSDGNLEANDGNFRGDITGASGTFSGTLTGGSLNIPDTTTANSFHVNTTGAAWWGCTNADFTSDNDNATAYILKTGVAKFQSVILNTSVQISDIIAGSEISIQGWVHDMTFSVTDADTVAWGSGTITLMDGTAYSIDAGNTGDMSAETYVYLDIGTSTTVLQTTTTKTTAIGSGKIMIAICENDTGEAIFRVFGSTEQNIDAGVLRAASISATEIATDAIEEGKIAADAVTATKIAVSGLDGATGDVAADHIIAGMIQTNAVTSVKINADAVTAAKINVVGLDGTSGRIVVADATDANAVAAGINTHAVTLIEAGKIIISGATNLDDWRKTGDLTMIDGGSISTGTVTATQILANTITANEITANTITASEIFAGTITATEMTIASLSAIAADLGTITAGNITLDSSGYIKGGQTAYATGTGFFLGYSTDAYKLSIGSPTNYLKWDGTLLTVVSDNDKIILKPSDETVNNSTTLQDDDDFTFSAAANTNYSFEMTLFGQSPGGAAFEYNFDLPAGATYDANTNGGVSAAPASVSEATNGVWNWTGGVDKVGRMVGVIKIGATAGTVTFQWAQDAAVADDTTVYAGSSFHFRKL